MSNSDTQDTDDFRSQFLDDYYTECDEHLSLIRQHFLTLEEQLGEGSIDNTLLDSFFRSFHTIKGISGMVGLAPAEQLAHSVEGMLRSLQQAEFTLTIEALDDFIESVALLERVIACNRSGDPLPDIGATVERLKMLSTVAATAGASLRPFTNVTTGKRRWEVEFTPAKQLADSGINVNEVRRKLQTIGNIVESTPKVKSDSGISFRFVVETDVAITSFPDVQIPGLTADALVDAPTLPESDPARGATPATAAGHSISANVVRVDLSRLDTLMIMIGETVASGARMQDQMKLAKKSLPSSEWRGLWETTQTIGRQLRDLREGVMRVRMVPIGEIFERMRFVVRDLARESGKRISLDIVGRETEIDKFLVERMKDPLLHLVRNAMSHGLEPPAEREGHGKPAEGHLSLCAATAGECIVLEVADDGRGIDVDEVVERARARGFVDAGQRPDTARLLDLICLPGFSTRSEADRESGRGVGMDVVKKTIEALGGTLAMSTVKGQGTKFTIELPLTLAIADVFIAKAGGQTYAVPQSTVREIIEVQPADVRALERNEIVAYRDGSLPLVRLAKLFNLSENHADGRNALHVLVTGTGGNTLGIAVDRVVGQREIVVRGIVDSLAQVPGIAGATDLGDERVVLILDVAALRRTTLDGNGGYSRQPATATENTQ